MSPSDIPASETVPISFVRSAIFNARARGHDCVTQLKESGIDPSLLRDGFGRVKVSNYASLQIAVMRLLGDETLGYAPVPSKVGTWHMACLSAVHPGSIGQAIGRMCKFYRVADCGFRPELAISGDEAVIELSRPANGLPLALYAYEMAFTITWRFIVWSARTALRIERIMLPHDAPDHAGEYRWMFPGAEIRFGQPRASLRFDAKVLEMPVLRASHELDGLLRTGAREMLDVSSASRSWRARIREIVLEELPRFPEFEEVSNRLDIHPQTLRRRLAQEGMTFSDIKNELRCEIAEYYLRTRTLSVEEIAFRSGFSEASSFIRAFRRWTGVTPRAFIDQRRTPRRGHESAIAPSPSSAVPSGHKRNGAYAS